MKKKKLIIVLVCTIIIFTCLICNNFYNKGYLVEEELLVYVPIDNRPDNGERVMYLAESLGYKMKMPKYDLYRTSLDYQPVNNNGTQYGDRAAIYEWILEQEDKGCNRYILSLDQLFSGGLVNSRYMIKHEDIKLSTGEIITEYEMIENLLLTLSKDPKNQVWLLDSVMRLAVTVGYKGFDIDEYNATRAYGMKSRKELTGDELTLENIIAEYQLADNISIDDLGMSDELKKHYLSARIRKLELTSYMLKKLNQLNSNQFNVLIGIDDSSAEDNIQKNEISYLKSLLSQDDTLISGVDDMALKAVSKLYLDENKNIEYPSIAIDYYGDTEDQPASVYNYKPLINIISEHIDFFGVNVVSKAEDADIHMLVLTKPLDTLKSQEYKDMLIKQLKKNKEIGKPTILVDAGNLEYDVSFYDELIEEVELGWLLGYDGFISMANVSGAAMSRGISRYVYLKTSKTTDSAERSYAKATIDSIVKCFCYAHTLRDEIKNYVRYNLNGDPNNFYKLDMNLNLVQDYLENRMNNETKPVIENLENSNYIYSLEPYTEASFGDIKLGNYHFPWYRAFEINFEIYLN